MAEATNKSGAGRWAILVVAVLAVIGTLALPRLLDLGADKCIRCKAMVPVLDELEKGLAGELTVQFVDVWKNPDEAKENPIKLIPTQIFLDIEGQEFFRHEGFFARDDILAERGKLGYRFELPSGTEG